MRSDPKFLSLNIVAHVKHLSCAIRTFFFYGARHWTQGFTYARCMFYHWRTMHYSLSLISFLKPTAGKERNRTWEAVEGVLDHWVIVRLLEWDRGEVSVVPQGIKTFILRQPHLHEDSLRLGLSFVLLQYNPGFNKTWTFTGNHSQQVREPRV